MKTKVSAIIGGIIVLVAIMGLVLGILSMKHTLWFMVGGVTITGFICQNLRLDGSNPPPTQEEIDAKAKEKRFETIAMAIIGGFVVIAVIALVIWMVIERFMR